MATTIDTSGGGTYTATDIDSSLITPPASSSTTPNIAPYLTAFGGLTSAYAAFQTGKINSQIANYNANLARLQSSEAIQSGDLASGQEAGRQKQREGAIAANFGAQNVSGGSQAAALVSSRNQSAMDQLIIQTNARRQAYGYQVRAASESTQAAQDMAQARSKETATLLYTGAQEELYQDPRFPGQRYGVNIGG